MEGLLLEVETPGDESLIEISSDSQVPDRVVVFLIEDVLQMVS